MITYLRKLFSRPRPRKASSVLKGNFTIDPTVQILGLAAVRIGDGAVLGEHTWLNVNRPYHQGIAITIGRYCFIGRRNFFTSGTLIELGDYCLTGPDCCFLGADHITDDPFRPYIVQAPSLRGEIRLGPNCWLAAQVHVIAPARIGYGCVVGAGAIVRGDLPPLSLAVGTPARVIKRYSLSQRRWVKLDEYDDSEGALPSEEEYLEKLRECPHPRMPVIASSSSLGSR